jgi:hypothetical protein
MRLILAIESDKRQAAQITAIARQRLKAELILADSAERGLAALGDRVPDLILTPVLLSPRDEDAIADHLRALDIRAAHVQTLTVPLLAAPASSSPVRGMLKTLRRDKSSPAIAEGCDPALFAEQVEAYLERAAAERARHAPVPAEAESVHAGVPADHTETVPAEAAPREPVAAPEPAAEPMPAPAPVQTASAEHHVRHPHQPAADAPAPIESLNDPRFFPERDPEPEPLPAAEPVPEVRDEPVELAAVAHAAPEPPPVEIDLEALLEGNRTGEAEETAVEPNAASAPEPSPDLSPEAAIMAAVAAVGQLIEADPPIAASSNDLWMPLRGGAHTQWPSIDSRDLRPAKQAARAAVTAIPVAPPAAAGSPAPDALPALPPPVFTTPAPRKRAPKLPPAAVPPGAATQAPRKKTRRPKPLQDEWGLFDPAQCGFAALVAKLEEITEKKDEAKSA